MQLLVAFSISLPAEIASALILTIHILERLAKNGGDGSDCWSQTDSNLHQLKMPFMAAGSKSRLLLDVLAALDQTAGTPLSRQLHTSHLGILLGDDFAFIIGDFFGTHLADGYTV